MKKRLFIIPLILLTACSTPNKINKVEQEKTPVITKEIENKKVIVTQILKDGYVEKHGEHYHFVRGEVPQNARILLQEYFPGNDDGFDMSNIESETEDGYIVRHGDHFHFVPKNKKTIQNKPVVTNKIIQLAQKYNISTTDITVSGDYYVIKHGDHYHSEKIDESRTLSTEIKKDMSKYILQLAHILNMDASLITAKDEETLVYPHLDHYHEINIKDIEKQHTIINEEKIKNYLVKAYNADVNLIKFNGDFVSFPDPSHDYESTHFHPIVFSLKDLIIPDFNENEELNFELELQAIASVNKLDIEKIQISDTHFILPHAGHDHYVNILSKGKDAYLSNKLEKLTGKHIEGTLNKESVLTKYDELINTVLSKFPTKVEQRRYLRVLEQLKNEIEKYPSNSTEGYLEMLQKFENVYILEKKLETTIEEIELAKTIDLFKEVDVSKFGLNRESIMQELYDNQYSLKFIYEKQHMLEEMIRFNKGDKPMSYAYITYFIENIESEFISENTKNEASKYIKLVFDYPHNKPFYEHVIKLLEIKKMMHQELNAKIVQTPSRPEHYEILQQIAYSNYTIKDIIEDGLMTIKRNLPKMQFSK